MSGLLFLQCLGHTRVLLSSALYGLGIQSVDLTLREPELVCVEVIFIFPIGIRVPKHKKEKMIDSPHIFKPDIDNCIKFILDCSNGIIWHDDCIVSVIFAKKIYGEARTIMTITEI